MKKTIIIFLLLSIYSLAQENRLIRQNDLTDSLNAIRTLIGTGGIALPDSVLFSSDSTAQRTFSDAKYPNKYLSNLGTTSINANLVPSATHSRFIGYPSLMWYAIYTDRWIWQGGTYSTTIRIIPPSDNKIIFFPDASGTIALGTGTSNQLSYWSGINTLGSLALDPATLEINGSNQLTVIGGTGSSGWFGLDGNGDLMPSLTATSDEYYELDGNGDIMPQL